ncbi:MAG: hypothetical protein AAFU61_12750, partial [Pseudomonadota bacterium]
IRFDTYLVDELTAVGDQTFKDKSRAVFKEKLADADVIMVSHSMNQLRNFCDCGIVLENGRIEVYDVLEDAIAAHLRNMARATGSSPQVHDLAARPGLTTEAPTRPALPAAG